MKPCTTCGKCYPTLGEYHALNWNPANYCNCPPTKIGLYPRMIQKKYSELVVGDVLHGMGEDRTITSFEEHPGLERDGKHYTARVAKSGGWGITCFDDEYVRKTSLGTWIDSHVWFSYEQSLKERGCV